MTSPLEIDTIVIHHHQHAVTFQNRAFSSQIQRHDVDVFQPDVLPDILLCPVGEREDAYTFAFINLTVIVTPQLWPLIFRVPAMETVTKGVNTFFRAGFFLIAPRAAERGIKTVLIQRLL